MTVTTKQVWEDFNTQLKGFILSRIPDEEDAADILQGIFSKIHSNISNLKDDDKLGAWVYQITRNSIVDHFRTGKSGTSLAAASVESLSHEPEEEAVDAAEWLRPFIALLPEKYQQAILLTEIGDLTQKELAGRIGLSESAARMRLMRARQQLKAALEECCLIELDSRGNILEYHIKDPTHCQCAGNES